MPRALTPLLALIAGACVPVPAQRAPDARAAPFPVFAFFSGHSEGSATLKIALRANERVRVESEGRVEGGILVLRQTIRQGDQPAREREWRIREVGPGRYAGTLSDAAGPVAGEAIPGRLHLRFRMKGGLTAEQWLTLAPDGRSADNVLVARKFGVAVAVLRERIVKRTPPAVEPAGVPSA
jgi:hypothetical protein